MPLKLDALLKVPRAVVLDLEATCCDDKSFPRSEMEVIEFGAVVVDMRTKQVIQEYDEFVRPEIHPVLTPFCTKLTSITQDDMAIANPFVDVFTRFLAECWDDVSILVTWGDFDVHILSEEFGLHRAEFETGGISGFPFPEERHLNAKQAVADALQIRRRGVSAMLTHLGLPFEGRHHRGIDDSKNIWKIVRIALVKKEH
jgi:inhibitor of KinA sporulation pathway (predicted exonuclease)